MRTPRLAVVACALLAARSAAAQSNPEPAAPPVVQMDNVAAPSSAPAPQGGDAPAPAPALAPTPPPMASAAPTSVGGAASSNDWKFDFHGYFRAPLRMGFGHNNGCPACMPAETAAQAVAAGQSSSTIHYPVVPDGQYLSPQYTSVQSTDWSELFLSYGNQWVKGIVGLQGYQFTDAAWQEASAQFGIAQAWLNFTPKTGYQNVHLESNVGAFWSKYGMSGKYDAGRYDTYLFGRTHQMGETVKASIDLGKTTLWAEEGFGAKQPDPSMYNPAKFSLLAHGHGGLTYNNMVSFNFHFLYAWAASEDAPANLNGTGVTTQPNVGLPDGNLMIFGPELIVRNTVAGDFYVGFSRIQASHATVVDDVVEVIHSGGGQEFSQGIQGNYLDGAGRANASHGNGTVSTLLVQYDFSLANAIAYAKKASFWGDGPDLTAGFFMMYNIISSDDTGTAAMMGQDGMDGVKKLKYGVDFLGTPVKFAGLGLRYDRVQPNSDQPGQSYSIVSPRLVFKSAFLTHEEVSVQYSRYIYNDRTCSMGGSQLACVQAPAAPVLPNGFGAPVLSLMANQRGAPNTEPDLNTLKVQATMWW